MTPPLLFHYTCDHAARSITRRGMLLPQLQPVLRGRRLVWLTDLEVADRAALGLTSRTLSCDRTANRYRVLAARDIVSWFEWAEANGIPAFMRRELEAVEDAAPARWFVSETAVLAELDRSAR